jgi:hypothetical protein
MSPMLPHSRPMSPGGASNLNSTNNLVQSGSQIRYSPLSPLYPNNNSSPIRGLSPGGSNRHYSGMSPSYSYNSPSSPNYTPNSSGKRALTKVPPRSVNRTVAAACIHLPLLTAASPRPTIQSRRPTISPPTSSEEKTRSTAMTKKKRMRTN